MAREVWPSIINLNFLPQREPGNICHKDPQESIFGSGAFLRELCASSEIDLAVDWGAINVEQFIYAQRSQIDRNQRRAS